MAKRQDIFRLLIPICLAIEMFASIACIPRAVRGNADFHQFYTGAYMVRTGYRHQLYDYSLQVRVGGSRLPSVHPAYEYLLFIPFSFFGYKTAYFLWMLVNICLAVIAIKLLQPYFRGSVWLLAGIVFAFIPVWITCYEGQDSLVLLFLFLLAARAEEFTSGFWIGLGAFKFHIVIPVMIVYCLWRKWRVIAGFCISGGLAAVISLSIVGTYGTMRYFRSASQMALTYLRPGSMPNVHGLLLRITGARFGSNHIVTVLAFVAALAAFLWAAWQQPSLHTAVIIIPFTAAYLLGHDLTLLLLPIAASELWLSWAGTVLLLPPTCASFAVLPLLTDIVSNRRSLSDQRQLKQ